MLRFEQLNLLFSAGREALRSVRATKPARAPSRPTLRDPELERVARELLHSVQATALRSKVRVEWNPRMRSAAGRAASHQTLISLNPRLREHGAAEIDRTLRHELAHLLAHFRAGRRRISPHGAEWRRACSDLGIADEQRCHTLPFPTQKRERRLLYRCPHCAKDFSRVRPLRRAMSCQDCCRQFNRGQFARRYQLQLVHRSGRN